MAATSIKIVKKRTKPFVRPFPCFHLPTLSSSHRLQNLTAVRPITCIFISQYSPALQSRLKQPEISRNDQLLSPSHFLLYRSTSTFFRRSIHHSRSATLSILVIYHPSTLSLNHCRSLSTFSTSAFVQLLETNE